MGVVSYKLMHKIISKRIAKGIDECVLKFKKEATNYTPLDPDYTEKLLKLSVDLQTECRDIARSILNEYDKELEGSPTLIEAKKKLSQEGK